MQVTSSRQASSAWLRLAAIDARALAWVAARRPGRLVRTMRLVSRTGDGALLAPVLVTLACLVPGRPSRVIGVAALAALVTSTIIKRLCRRARPVAAALLTAPDQFSLPSGHTACAFAIAVSAVAACPALAPLLLAWATAVGLSRVVLGVHYPLDVAVGAVLGAMAAAAVLALGV